MTVVKGKNNYLPHIEGRHNTVGFFLYFASMDFQFEASCDIVLRNCTVDNVHRAFHYGADAAHLQAETHFVDITFEKRCIHKFRADLESVRKRGGAFERYAENVTYEFREVSTSTELMDPKAPNVSYVIS